MSIIEKQSTFMQKESLTYTGSAAGFAITLDRGAEWSIKKIQVYAANAGAGAYVQVLRKASASTANERDSSNTASKNVLIGEWYLSASNEFEKRDFDDRSTVALRLYIDLDTTNSDTIYVNIEYAYEET